ncbi:MAG: HEAT repeat domain-containing protein [Planctomycetes bacterium]|nr:HEAT repeat domain-containing protein [Planctomycetota bacterium]
MNRLSHLSLALSAAAAILAGLALYQVRNPAPVPVRATDDAPPVPGQPDRPIPKDPAVTNPPTNPGTDPELLARLDRFEERLAALEKRRGGGGPDSPKAELDRKSLETKILDGTLTPLERASAFQRLRLRWPSARTLEIARSMIDLLRVSEDAGVRFEICRQLSGLDYPEVGDEMLTRARTDKDEHTRAEATRALESFLDNPGVLQALETVKESDPSEFVRAVALDVLEYGRRR